MKNRHLKDTERSRSAEYQYLELGKEILVMENDTIYKIELKSNLIIETK